MSTAYIPWVYLRGGPREISQSLGILGPGRQRQTLELALTSSYSRPSFSDVACCLRGSHKSSETWVGQLQRLRVNSSPGAVGFSESKGSSQIKVFKKNHFLHFVPRICLRLSLPVVLVVVAVAVFVAYLQL